MATQVPEDAQRKEYSGTELSEETISDHPLVQFKAWYRAAETIEEQEANAMSVASVSEDGKPSTRIVLLKGFDDSGFVFYSNYTSRKAQELLSTGEAALLFWWPRLARQVRIEGPVVKTIRAESEEYFATRPRGSQIGAWASRQSSVVQSRDDLSASFADIESKYANKVVPCPPEWGGFRVIPRAYEFWQGQENRLHDRILYSQVGEDEWKIVRLSP